MRKLTAITLTLVLLLTGCKVAPVTPDTTPDAPVISEPEPEPTPVAPDPAPEKAARTYESVSVQLYEKDSYVFIFPASAEMTEVDGCRYYFKSTISESDREAFIEAQTALNEKLSAPEGLSFYVLCNYTFRSESENSLAFYEIGGTATWRQALVTVQLLEGDTVNYGWAYARADALARELGWETDSFDAPEDVDGVFIDDPGMLNLVYPCFIEPYSTEAETAAAKSLALELYSDGEDESAFLGRACEYAEKLGVEFTPTKIRFAYEGKTLPLVIYTEFTENRIGKDYALDENFCCEKNVMNDITMMVYILEKGCQVMERTREAFGYDGKERAIVRYKNMIGGITYSGSKPKIEVGEFYVIPHEYTHYIHFKLLKDKTKDYPWIAEAVAEYFAIEIEYDSYLALWTRAAETGETSDPLLSMEENLGRDALRKSVLKRAEAGEDPIEQLTVYGSCYAAKASMGFYIAETYGEKTLIKVALDPDNIELYLGISRDELFDNWTEFIMAPA